MRRFRIIKVSNPILYYEEPMAYGGIPEIQYDVFYQIQEMFIVGKWFQKNIYKEVYETPPHLIRPHGKYRNLEEAEKVVEYLKTETKTEVIKTY
jgi:hypothetical protein